jgi:DnaJ-class molecular chaperone
MRNPYEILGLQINATEADVKKSFRRLAKQYHPDRKSEDPRAKERFNEITHAYDILGDATKRAKFDRGEIDAEGKPKHPGFEGFGQGGSPRGHHGGGHSSGNTRDFFSDIFGGFSSQKGRSQGGFSINDFEDDDFAPQNTSQSLDVSAKVTITLEDIANGENVRVTLPNGKEIDVKIPAGVQNGQIIRLRGQGHRTARQAGDVLLTLNFASHPIFKIEGNDLTQKLDIPLADAVLGGKIRIPTLTSEIEMNLPAWTNSGRVFRLRGKGLPTKSGSGDLLVTLNISLPKDDKELEELFRKRRDFTV